MPRKRSVESPQLTNTQIIILKICSFVQRNFIKFFLQYLLFAIALFLTTIVKINIEDFQPINYWIIFGSPVITTGLTYIKDSKFNHEDKKKALQYKTVFEITGAGIADIRDVIYVPNQGSTNYLKDSLNRIRAIVELLKIHHQLPSGTISANFMKKEGNVLKIIEFDLRTEIHEVISLEIDSENPRPGAPRACVTKKPQYVSDVRAANVRQYFTNPRYMSFFSIPIKDRNGEIFGVINVDSSERNGFNNLNFINDIIKPTILPIINLVQLENCIRTNNHHAGDQIEGGDYA
jgi:hypothetical protein